MSPSDRSDAVGQLNEIGQLAAGVGHHVINAFSAIVSNAELLRLPEENRVTIDPVALADSIILSAVEASGVARRLIDHSRYATAPGEGLVAVDRLVAQVIADHQQRVNASSIEWVSDLQPVPMIRGNEQQLTAMLGHLIRNSLEAMPVTGGSIVVRTRLDDRNWVVLEVCDTGTGMPHKIQERAVEPFFTTKNGHSGIGLSIANGIWRRHRGTLALKSQSGEGTRVRLCIDPERNPR